ncbi:MAG TPA: efflux RND transporter periplasmic adaptor subunit [Burkholderiaceae bacterium]|jgi:RND family efflux transporter MFP subunit|nr:efflux RND transporter periplasmic adaptor subunit [Burkholderiaceae bacterium]
MNKAEHPEETAAVRGTFLARRNTWIAIAAAAVAAGSLAVALAPKAGASAEKAPAPLQFSATEVTQPSLAPMPQRIDFSGPLVAPRTAIVRAKAAGTLLNLAVGEGSRVKAGQPLGAMDLSDLQSRIAERSASVESAQALLAEAQRQHEANQALSRQNFISPTALQSSQAKLDAAQAQLKSARAQLASQSIGLREAALVAPISGIVGKRHAVPGEKLSAEQPLLTVVDLSTLELVGTVAPHEVSRLKVGQAVQVLVEGQDQPVAARIDRIAPQAEAGTRAIGVVVVLENRGERFRAGQYAQASVTLADATPRLSVPLSAVTQASGQDQVWTLENGVLVRRIVITGRKDAGSGRIEVLRGLEPQATVLAMRFDNLREGASAMVRAAGSAPEAAASASAPAASRS